MNLYDMLLFRKLSGGGVQPTGKLAITSTDEVDCSSYATAQVEDENLVAGNIKKDVEILGVAGTFDPSIAFGVVHLVNSSGYNWNVTHMNADGGLQTGTGLSSQATVYAPLGSAYYKISGAICTISANRTINDSFNAASSSGAARVTLVEKDTGYTNFVITVAGATQSEITITITAATPST